MVIDDRGELRDFDDLKVIEAQAGRLVEEGLGLFLRRYRPLNADAAVRHLLLGLGYFDDVATAVQARADTPRTGCLHSAEATKISLTGRRCGWDLRDPTRPEG